MKVGRRMAQNEKNTVVSGSRYQRVCPAVRPWEGAKKLRLQSRRKSSGFFLLEIAMVLAILGFVLTIGLKSTGA